MTNRDLILQTLDVIEAEIQSDMTVPELARRAGYSLYHFIRLFEGVTGYTPKDYILQRKLTEAAKELLRNERKIVDIAFDYQFGSHEAFSRAFRRFFRKSPAEFRKDGFRRGTFYFEKMSQVSIRNMQEYGRKDPELVRLGKIYLAGPVSFVNENYSVITDLWQKLESGKETIRMIKKPERFFQLSFWSDGCLEPGFFCMAGIETVSLEGVPFPFCCKEVPAASYLKFIHGGISAKVIETYEFIYKHWLPKTEYRLTEPYNLELYGENFKGPYNPESESEIYIPVKTA